MHYVLITLLGLVFLMPASLQAQVIPLEKMRFSVEAGASYAAFPEINSYYVRVLGYRVEGYPSFTLGTEASLPLGAGVWGEAGVRYARIVRKADFEKPGIEGPKSEGVSKLSSHHLLVPLGLRYHVLEGPVYLSANVGPAVYLGFRSYFREDYDDPARKDVEETNSHVAPRVNAILSGGVGFFVPAFGRHLRLEARYAHLTKRSRSFFGGGREISLNASYTF